MTDNRTTEKLYGVDTWTDLDDIGVSHIEPKMYRTREAAEKRASIIKRGYEDDGYRTYARVVEFEVGRMKITGIDTYGITRIDCEECGAVWLFAEHQDMEYRDVRDIAYCPFCAHEERESE